MRRKQFNTLRSLTPNLLAGKKPSQEGKISLEKYMKAIEDFL